MVYWWTGQTWLPYFSHTLTNITHHNTHYHIYTIIIAKPRGGMVNIIYIYNMKQHMWLWSFLSTSIAIYKFVCVSADQVKFGEVVKAPPKLNAKPRGSQSTKKTRRNSMLTFASTLSSSSSSACERMPVGLKHEQDMEDERLRVISSYRLTKKIKMHRTHWCCWLVHTLHDGH